MVRDIVRGAAKQLGSEAAKQNCHSEGNNNFIPKNLVIANTEVYPSKSSLTEGRLMLQGVVHDNNFNLTETVFSHFTSHVSLPKVAFTLAEVLITLGIIGVVAALTLPSVIQNYRKQVILNKIKRTYTVLNNTIERAKADYGTNVNEWYIPSGDERTKSMYFVENYMLPYLNVLEYCKDQSVKPICKEIVHYFNTTAETIGPVSLMHGTNFILTDGTNVYVQVGRINGSESMDTKRIMVDFDIDGVNSGKNTYGYDVFRVELGGGEGYNLKNNADKNKFLPYRYIPSDSCDYYVGTQPHSCNKKAITGGSMCLAYIVCNGWSFGDKYPW